jgi:hypothetical protein
VLDLMFSERRLQRIRSFLPVFISDPVDGSCMFLARQQTDPIKWSGYCECKRSLTPAKFQALTAELSTLVCPPSVILSLRDDSLTAMAVNFDLLNA